jgi:hypothetical protein
VGILVPFPAASRKRPVAQFAGGDLSFLISPDPGNPERSKGQHVHLILVVLPMPVGGFWIGKLYVTKAEFSSDILMLT